MGRGRSSVDGRQDGPRHRCDLGARPGGRRRVCAARRARPAARAQRGARGASARCRGRGDGQPRRAGVSVRRERPARRAGVRGALHRRRAAPRRPRQQRRRAAARAGGLRGRQRARACDERARTVPAHEPADPSAHGERSGAGHHRLLGRDVHAAAPCRGPAVDGREVRRTDGVRADQARAGDPHRAVGEAARRHRGGRARDAPRLGGHAGRRVLAAALSPADRTAAAQPRTGGRHDRLARRGCRAGREFRRLLARPQTAPDASRAVDEGDARGSRAALARVRAPHRPGTQSRSRLRPTRTHKGEADGALHRKHRNAASPRRDVRVPQRLLHDGAVGPGRRRGAADRRRSGRARDRVPSRGRRSSAARPRSPTGSSSSSRARPSRCGARTRPSSRSTGSRSSRPTGARGSPTTPTSR